MSAPGTGTATMTSTTAPGKVFGSRSELADHYKSDWHKYNLRRREAGLVMLNEHDFTARWEAALALKAEKERTSQKNGQDHIKNKNKKNHHKKKNKKDDSATTMVKGNSYDEFKNRQQQQEQQQGDEKMSNADDQDQNDGGDDIDDDTNTNNSSNNNNNTKKVMPAALVESQENPEIDPNQSLFDSHRSETLNGNMEYMHKKYGFFVPDQECLLDGEGLLGYLHEKIKLGHYCLYCEKVFPTWQGCQQHMINKQHTKLRYEQGHDWDELDPFYDFSSQNQDFLIETGTGAEGAMDVEDNGAGDGDDDEDEGGWEDMSDDGNDVEGNEQMDNGEDEADDDVLYEGYEKEIARFGLNVTELGELVFPDGRVVGHRALRRYYKQRPRTHRTSTAVVAAQEAAGERLYDGRVININQYQQQHPQHPLRRNEVSGTGKGILVATTKDGPGGPPRPAQFSTLSLYRYRAAVRKERRGFVKFQKIQQKTNQNINKMDKKHNRLMNGVSVAHAAR
mmetsp:Transcript_57915/g.141501  ORF Transcript_57915/g.141501 Transcript_57915/m.141501 type:complete len:507 (+) Transcript_57915:108-1628(+)